MPVAFPENAGDDFLAHQIHDEPAPGLERLVDVDEDTAVFGRAFEVAERGEQIQCEVEGIGSAELAHVFLHKLNLQPFAVGLLLRAAQVNTGAINTGDGETATREFEAVPAVAVAEVEHLGRRFQLEKFGELIDFGGGVGDALLAEQNRLDNLPEMVVLIPALQFAHAGRLTREKRRGNPRSGQRYESVKISVREQRSRFMINRSPRSVILCSHISNRCNVDARSPIFFENWT